MVILPAKFSELLKAWSSLAYSTGSSCTYSSPGSTQSKNTSKGTTIHHGAKHKQHDAIHDMICEMWYAMHMRTLEGKMMNKASTWQTKYAAGKMRWFRLKSIWRSPETDALFAESVNETCYVYMGAIISSGPFWLMVSKGLLIYALRRFLPCLVLLL